MAKTTRRSGSKSVGRQWTEEEARAVLDSWSESGDSGAAFAKTIGTSPQRLFWWRRRLSVSKPLTFVPVIATESRADPEAALVITTAAGTRIEVRDVDASTAAWVAIVLAGTRS